MKSFATQILAFLFICIGGAILGLSLCLLYIHATQIIAGQSVGYVPDGLPLVCLLYSCAVVAFFSCVFLINYTIRHPQKKIPQLLAFCLVMLIAWGFVIPFCLNKADSLQQNIVMQEETALPSRKYFRPDTDGVFFYSNVSPDTETADGIYIDTSGFTGSKSGIIPLKQVPINKDVALPFSDLLIRDTLQLPQIVKPILNGINVLCKNAVNATQGLLSWLIFSTMGLALGSLFGLRSVFRWRLLNCLSVLICFVGIISTNIAYYMGWPGVFFGIVEIPLWVMNCIISGVFICLGTVLAIFRPDPNMERS
ncbi:MAG: hypothetical protein J6B81_00995 [Spirochaetaceae bacterium]|nr:hypothetical protein [Spirochaetaceae bacterium]